ncbi:MAG: TetR family transcriptional regulator [Pseudolysinimonas sp.]|uniref:TetR/AcrR family transcriptional regulator n=1 Tax=Pseudolysinimonas sp. TaxID=2680009 RepID=UPI003C777664
MTIQAQPIATRAGEILDVAERLVQTRGFNAFSYADIAAELGVTKPALHYHFRTKEALGEALIARYSERFFRELDQIATADEAAPARVARYVELYRAVLLANRMCLCGILAAEYQTLPSSMRSAVRGFFERNETWLANVLRQGVEHGEVTASEPLEDAARLVIDTLEGAMMIARAHDGPERFDSASTRLIAGLLP